jgi:hypothetical protein
MSVESLAAEMNLLLSALAPHLLLLALCDGGPPARSTAERPQSGRESKGLTRSLDRAGWRSIKHFTLKKPDQV